MCLSLQMTLSNLYLIIALKGRYTYPHFFRQEVLKYLTQNHGEAEIQT